ncbi:MAG: diacylglycerol kinase family protein [Bacteroidota bacterium]|nr:diacylglycerol kinase family protein [Bacteroidota bacterium]
MSSDKSFSITDRIKSFGFAFEGIITFFKTQHNAWIHAFATVIVVVLGFALNVNNTEWCLLAVSIALVFISEMLNSAIEFLTDIVSPDYNLKAKKVKDVAAGAVLISAIAAVVIGLIIFLPKLW